MNTKIKWSANPYQFSSNYEEINRLQVLRLHKLAAGSPPFFPREGRTKDYLHLQRQQPPMPKKGIFEKFLNSFLCFSSYPISDQFPIFSHSSLLAAAPSGPFSGPRKAGREAHSCLFS